MSVFDGFEHITREGEPLGPHTWLRLGGPAQYFAEPTTTDELCGLIRRCREHDLPIHLLGGGSRVLISDAGVKGLVISLAAPAFCDIQVDGNTLTAGGGARLSHLVSTAVREGLAGLESLMGVPGTVAGALRGNADNAGVSIGQWTKEVTVVGHDAEIVTRTGDRLQFSYGESNLDDLVILSAQFVLEKGDPAELTRRMQKLWIVRRAAQPSIEMGVGRIFKDPHGLGAAKLIEQVGLRGHQIGKARISTVDGNFIEVESGATSRDVEELIALMRSRVATALGVNLELEIEVW